MSFSDTFSKQSGVELNLDCQLQLLEIKMSKLVNSHNMFVAD